MTLWQRLRRRRYIGPGLLGEPETGLETRDPREAPTEWTGPVEGTFMVGEDVIEPYPVHHVTPGIYVIRRKDQWEAWERVIAAARELDDDGLWDGGGDRWWAVLQEIRSAVQAERAGRVEPRP